MKVITSTDDDMPFRSLLERAAWEDWIPTLDGIHRAFYEPFTLHLPSGNYKPDFVLQRDDGTLVVIEVKGSWSQRGGSRSKQKLKEAANHASWIGDYFAILPVRRKTKKGRLMVEEWKIEKFGT